MAQARDRLLRRQAVPLADAFASPSAEVDWGCEGQADWSKRVGVALSARSGVSQKCTKKPPENSLPKTQQNAPFWMLNLIRPYGTLPLLNGRAQPCAEQLSISASVPSIRP